MTLNPATSLPRRHFSIRGVSMRTYQGRTVTVEHFSPYVFAANESEARADFLRTAPGAKITACEDKGAL